MNLVERIAGGAPRAAAAGEDTLWAREVFVGGRSTTGAVVDVERALHLDSVFAAIRLIAEAGGSLPLKTYEKREDGARAEALDDPVYDRLHDEPNPEMSAMDLWSLVLSHGAAWGNAFIGKRRAGAQVPELWPLMPDRMTVSRQGRRKIYEYMREDGRIEQMSDADVIHVHGLSLDGLVGLSPIAMARESIGATLAGQAFAGRLFSNAAVPRGVLEIPGELGEEAARRLSAQWHAAQGGRNLGKVAVLEGGAKFNPITMPLEDAQFVEQQKLSVQQVARIFGIAPELIGGESGGSLTYSTVEGQALAFLTYCLRPWLVRIEQALRRDDDLFPRIVGRRRRRYPEFVQDAMLRADAKTRAEINAIALDPDKGWKTREEVRAADNLGPESGGGGSRRLRDLRVAESAGLAAQRLGLAKDYGAVSQDQIERLLKLDGIAPDGSEVSPDRDRGQAALDAAAHMERVMAELKAARNEGATHVIA